RAVVAPWADGHDGSVTEGRHCEEAYPSGEADRLANNAAFVYSLEESGLCQLYSPDRAAHIKWALCLDEGRGLAAEDPYVRVRRLLPHQTRQEPGDTSDFHFHNIVHGFMMEASNRERLLAVREDRKLD